MNSQSTYRTSQHTRNISRECCTDLKCESGLRNNYFDGKRLTPDSFQVEQRYMLERRRLLNRAIHGWGVVYGYGITTETPYDFKETKSVRLRIGDGLALDPCGRELLQLQAEIELDDVILLVKNRNGQVRVISKDEFEKGYAGYLNQDTCWLLSVHYAEQKTDPLPIKDPCRCEHHEWDHTCETVRYSLQPVPCAECCDDFDCELCCECGTGPCCEESIKSEDARASIPPKRGGCRCLCEYLTGWAPEAECDSLCEIKEPCAHVRVDVRNGVPLACVNLVKDDCGLTFGEEVETCGPRRLVKRNDMLFDLIRGCDLTRIKEIGWRDWHRQEEPIRFDVFSKALGQRDSEGNYLTEIFWVEFSRPVRANTLRPDCFAMTIMALEREGGWWQTFRVPIVGVNTTLEPPQPGDPKDYVTSARIIVDGSWVEDGVRGRRTIFQESETRVEIEVRGDFIVDCNGLAVDANAVGLSPSPTGNGTPGGTFLSTFRVEQTKRDVPARTILDDDINRQKGV